MSCQRPVILKPWTDEDEAPQQVLSRHELGAARELGAVVSQLQRNDIVVAILPDGTQLVVMGRARMDRIIATGNAEHSATAFVPVLSIEAAAALEQVLGGDGFYSQPRTVGHA